MVSVYCNQITASACLCVEILNVVCDQKEAEVTVPIDVLMLSLTNIHVGYIASKSMLAVYHIRIFMKLGLNVYESQQFKTFDFYSVLLIYVESQ